MSPPSPLGAHYRTPLGAFYRTPLGAFGIESEPPATGTWRVSDLDFPDSFGGGVTDACVFGNENITYYGTTLAPIISTQLDKSIATGTVTFTGDISGAVYIWNGPPSCFLLAGGVGDGSPLVAPTRTYKPYDIWVYDAVDFNFYQTFSMTRDAPGVTGFQAAESVTISVN